MVNSVVDPVEAGLVESFARPGGNVTGLTLLSRELGGKRLELLKEAVPKLARVAVLYDPANPGSCTRGERGSPGRGAGAGVDRSAMGGTSMRTILIGFLLRWTSSVPTDSTCRQAH